MMQRLPQNRQILRQRGFQAARHVHHRAMRQRLLRHIRQRLRHIVRVHRLQRKPPARRQHQHRQSRQLNKQLAARPAAPKHHARARNIHPQTTGAHRRIATPLAAHKRHLMRSVRAQCRQLHPRWHAHRPRQMRQLLRRVMMHLLQHIGMAAHHANAVHHAILPVQQALRRVQIQPH